MEGEKTKLLVVDDDQLMNVLYEETAKTYFPDLTLDAVNSGEDALTLIENGCAPDLVISDVNMGGMDGLELAKKVREKIKNVFMILTSGAKHDELPAYLALPELRRHDEPDNPTAQLAELMATGVVDEFLPKTGGIEQIKEAVAAALKETEMRPELEKMRMMPPNYVLLKLHEAKNQGKDVGKGVMLVIDDDPGIRFSVKTVLRSCRDFEIIDASDPEEALRKINEVGKDRVAFIISDNNMGYDHMDGPNFIRSLRADPAFKRALISLFSANYAETDTNIINLANNGLINFFLPKPFEAKSLFSLLRDAAIRQYRAVIFDK